MSAYSYVKGRDAVDVYPAPGYCIYCFRDSKTAKITQGTPFGKEHIFPLALYGNIVFLKASCRNCAEIINQEFEQEFISLFQNTRAHLGFRSRKNKDRPRMGKMVDPEGKNAWIDVPIDRHPVIGVFFGLENPPAYLTGEDISVRRTETGWVISGLNMRSSGVPLQGNFQTRISPEKWARSLAKIAHSYMLAVHGDEFVPLLLDIIFGRTTYYGDLIGRSSHPVNNSHPPHSIKITRQNEFCIVTVGIFTAIGGLNFDVVAGRCRQ